MYFVDCIEEVRKQVFRRRLRTEVTVKKPYSSNDAPESLELEETLMKLA